LLIGADLYGLLLLGDLRQGPLDTPTTQKTELVGHIRFYWYHSVQCGQGSGVALHLRMRHKYLTMQILGG